MVLLMNFLTNFLMIWGGLLVTLFHGTLLVCGVRFSVRHCG